MKLARTVYPEMLGHDGCVLTIGNFDGMHRGHQAIVHRLMEIGRERQVPAVLMTFLPSPQAYFLGREAAPVLTSISTRCLALQGCEIDTVIAVPFNRRLAETQAQDFIQQYIVDGLGTRHLLVGDDFRFGAGRKGDFNLLCEQGGRFGFEVEQVQTITEGGERISSTRVRQALTLGELDVAHRLLGRPYSMTGRVAHGDKRGRQWGFPTINLPLRTKPALTGIFSVMVRLEDGDSQNGVASLGTRPTVDGTKTILEVYLLDFSGDLYGQRVCVEFLEKIREEESFDSVEKLRQQIQIDCESARDFFDRQVQDGR